MRRHFTIFFPLSLGLVLTVAIAHSARAVNHDELAQAVEHGLSQACEALPGLNSAELESELGELYRQHDFRPLWADEERLTALGAAVDALADDGLRPEDYPLARQSAAPQTLCEELQISAEYLQALEHLSRGRLLPTEVEPLWQANGLPSATVPAMAELAWTGIRSSISLAFDEARPDLREYQRLREAYSRMDKQAADRVLVPSGPLLRPGMNDPRIAQIAAYLHEDGFLQDLQSVSEDMSAQHYGAELREAMERFQASRGLQVDGLIGPRTLSALSVSPSQRVEQVEISLERLRWIHGQRSDYLLLINIASNQLQLLRGNELLWQARAQTGRPRRPTPALISRINRLTLNPSWTVPPTIFREDILPQIQRNPAYLATQGMQTLDTQGQPLDPAEIDWRNPRGIILRQPPGPANPLGRVAFRFPNPFAIYLHDTPSQHLFQQADRHVSSGCVRVEQAETLAWHLLASLTEVQRTRIEEQLRSGETHEVALQNGPQVILAYWTAYVTEDGQLAFMPDSYGLDQAVGNARARPGEERQERFVSTADIARRAEAGCDYYSGDTLNPQAARLDLPQAALYSAD